MKWVGRRRWRGHGLEERRGRMSDLGVDRNRVESLRERELLVDSVGGGTHSRRPLGLLEDDVKFILRLLHTRGTACHARQ
jgi:hypothetical protein